MTNLQRALDRAVAAENRDPRGLPAEDLEALDTPGIHRAFHDAAARVQKPCPVSPCYTCKEESK